MNSLDGNNLWDFAGSIGWLIDRTGETEQILATVWLVADGQVATCAIPVVPYEEILDSLIVRFPFTGQQWGVREAEFHPGFDRWLSKRALSQAAFHPSISVANQQLNICVLRLSEKIRVLDRETIQRFNKLLLRILPQEEAGFSGRVSNVELTSILQMLLNARREGTIVICDPRKRRIARIFCEDGRIAYARFGQSKNEDAIYKLMCSQFTGYFYFQEERRPEWCDFTQLVKGTTSIIMEGYRRFELKTKLLEEVGGESAVLRKRKYRPHFQNLAEQTQADAQVVWCYLYDGMPVSRLLQVCGSDNSLVMAALYELISHDYITVSKPEQAPVIPPACRPLPRSAQVPPSPGDQIFAITLDPVLGPHLAGGRVICERKPGDPLHQVHTIALPDEALGTPIFKDDSVVGIYCGKLIPEPTEPQEYAYMQQMLWVAAVNSCLGEIPGARAVQPMAAEQTSETTQSLAAESTEPAAEQKAAPAPVPRMTVPPTVGGQSESGTYSLTSFLGSLSSVFQPFGKARHKTVHQWFDLEVTRAECGSVQWVKATSSTIFRPGDLLRLHIKLLQDLVIYALFQGSTFKHPSVLYPESLENIAPQPRGTLVQIPGHNQEQQQGLRSTASSNRYSLLGIPIPNTVRGGGGTESLLLLASKTPLQPLTEPDNIESIFTKSMILLNGQNNLDLVEIEENILYEGLENVSAHPNLIAITKLRVSHHG